MRPSRTHSAPTEIRPLPPRESRRELRARAPSAIGVALVALALGACVTSAEHQRVSDERDSLAQTNRELADEVARLVTSNESLEAERVRVLDEVEDLRLVRAELEPELATLRRREREISENLAAREAALATSEAELKDLRGTYDGLVAELESDVAAGRIQIDQLREGLRLNLADDVLFESGSAALNEIGREVLLKVSALLRGLDHTIEVQGHTDDRPIRKRLAARFPSNWELAAARATRVARLLVTAGIDGGRVTASSYAEYHPVVANDSPENRARNRRIEIRLRPVSAAASEPVTP